jgi:hypothetical protein
MQAYSGIVDKTITYDSLEDLGAKLKMPDGWKYRVITLDKDLVISTPGGFAWITQDDLENTYDACRNDACNYKALSPVDVSGDRWELDEFRESTRRFQHRSLNLVSLHLSNLPVVSKFSQAETLSTEFFFNPITRPEGKYETQCQELQHAGSGNAGPAFHRCLRPGTGGSGSRGPGPCVNVCPRGSGCTCARACSGGWSGVSIPVRNHQG